MFLNSVADAWGIKSCYSYKPKSQDQDCRVESLLRVDPLTFTNLPLGTFVALPPPVI